MHVLQISFAAGRTILGSGRGSRIDTHDRLRQLARRRKISLNGLLEELSTAAIAELDAEAEATRTRLQVRHALRKSRVAMINAVRGTLRALGYRMGSVSADRFVQAFYRLEIPLEVEERLRPLLEMMVYLTERIDAEEAEIRRIARADGLLRRLQTTPGIGPVVSTAYAAWVDDPYRFARSAQAGRSAPPPVDPRGGIRAVPPGRVERRDPHDTWSSKDLMTNRIDGRLREVPWTGRSHRTCSAPVRVPGWSAPLGERKTHHAPVERPRPPQSANGRLISGPDAPSPPPTPWEET